MTRWVQLKGTWLVGRVREVHDETGAVHVGGDRWWPEDSVRDVGPLRALYLFVGRFVRGRR